jgi:hypothetical protein
MQQESIEATQERLNTRAVGISGIQAGEDFRLFVLSCPKSPAKKAENAVFAKLAASRLTVECSSA